MSNHLATGGLGSAKPTSARILGALLAVATASEAQNLIVLNPEFDEAQMISGWGDAGTATEHSWVSDDDADACHLGSGHSGAIRTVSTFRPQTQTFHFALSPEICFSVQPGQTFHTEIAFREGEELYLLVTTYDQVGCGGSVSHFFGDVISQAFDWQIYRQSFTVPAGHHSMSLVWRGDGEFVALHNFFDRAYVGLDERLFADDFEAGASCRWSSVVGEVIVEDVTPPTDPGPIDSASHDLGAAPPPILLSWAPSTDSESGLRTYRAGFAAGLFEVLCGDLQEVGIVTGGQSQDDLPLDTYYFYLCAEDHAGNQSNVVVGGPYVVSGEGEDVTPPTDPGPIDSASHDSGAAPPPILLSWAPSTDSGSGLRTYRAGLAAGLFEILCGDLQEIGIATGGQSQDDLPLDTYYFYLCAEDNAGNQSNVVVGGPYVVQ